MKKSGKVSRKDADWAEAKRLCRLSVEDIQKAKALGFLPKSLTKNNPSPSQRWKMPVREWVRSLYEKKFGDEKFVVDRQTRDLPEGGDIA